MVRNKSDLLKLVFYLVFLTFILCSHANLESENVYSNETYMDIVDIERFKNDLFSPKTNDEFRLNFFDSNNLKCLEELGKIGTGLYDKKLWAIKSKWCFFLLNLNLFFHSNFALI